MGEFELIERFFAHGPARHDVLLGVGDDAAVVDAGTGDSALCVVASIGMADGDTLKPDPRMLAYDLVCPAFNRLASRGITPAWYTLALCLPKSDEEWVEGFCRALYAAASPCGAVLIGGDTTRGPLAATLVAHGTLPASADPDPPSPAAGSAVYMTGEIGCRSPATADEPGDRTPVPPRVDAGILAFAHVSAAADIRGSLAATLNDMLEPFELGVSLEPLALPVAEASVPFARRQGGLKLLAETAADPELCFVVALDREQAFRQAMGTLSTPCTRIGVVSVECGVRISDARH